MSSQGNVKGKRGKKKGKKKLKVGESGLRRKKTFPVIAELAYRIMTSKVVRGYGQILFSKGIN